MKTSTYLNTKQKRRRGVAMELAIAVVLILSALSILLVSTALLQSSRARINQKTLESEVRLCEIGEGFCAAVAAGEELAAWQQSVTDYKAETATAVLQDGSTEVTLALYDSEEVLVLSVRLTAAPAAPHTITEWTYHK